MWYDCLVCGNPNLMQPPRKSTGGASFEICASCGYQFGYTDDAQGIPYEQWRQAWVAKGMPWTGCSSPPREWDPREQLRTAGLSRYADPPWNWVETLAAARGRPEMFVVEHPLGAHLCSGIARPLRVVWEHQAFEEPHRATLLVSPCQYRLRCETGPLRLEAQQAVEWETQDRLLVASPVCAACSGIFLLADRAVMAIRTSAGLWCQSYERGWPTTPPYQVTDTGHEIGLMVAAALNPQWCPGLPFTLEAVRKTIPEAARPFVTVEWHPEDDLLPQCAPDAHCVHHPANIGRWL